MAYFNPLTSKLEGVGNANASQLKWRGCVRKQTVGQGIPGGPVIKMLNTRMTKASADFDAVNLDLDPANVIVIPDNVSLVRARFARIINSSSAICSAWINKEQPNGGQDLNYWGLIGAGGIRLYGESSPISVVPGDRFAFYMASSSAISTAVGSGENNTSWFEIEVLE